MNASELRDLLELIIQSPVEDFHLEAGTVKVSLKKPGSSTGSISGSDKAARSLTADASEISSELSGSPQSEEEPEFIKLQSLEEIQVDEAIQDIVSPMVGQFYFSSNQGDPPLVKVGDVVSEDTIVGVVEMMKLFNEIQAGAAGEIVEILVEDGQLVEYDQPLFRIKKREASRYV